MKKTSIITLTSKPLCAEALNGKGHRSIVEACEKTTGLIAEMVSALIPQMEIEFVNQVDEETPCNQDRNKFYLRLSMSKTE